MSAWTALRTLPKIMGLMVRVPGWALDYSLNYKRAKKKFKQSLIDEGVPPDEADELAELYPFKMSHLIETARRIN
ncbi:hypothetical protein GF326_08935 [Candidatus Bathyarchaeota archaeon]|nr:hypothetical protein [Candidatus Bathyarchaeota archaeon]